MKLDLENRKFYLLNKIWNKLNEFNIQYGNTMDIGVPLTIIDAIESHTKIAFLVAPRNFITTEKIY